MFRALDAFSAGRFATDTIPPEDARVERLITTLDSLLALPETPDDLERDARTYLRYFGIYLEKGLLTDEQTAGVVARLDEIETRYPALGEMIDNERFRAENLIPGKVPPKIVGKDTDGREFRLTDYRGNIIVLVFSGDWCPPCREEYPYQREMLERYGNEKVVLLGVSADHKLEKAQEVKEQQGLNYRTWWDGPPIGPISSSWKVWAFPETFVLDENGVILHVGKRGDKLIEAVDAALARSREPSGEAETLPPS